MINGERVRLARELLGMTQTQLAKSVGVTQAAIAQVECGVTAGSDHVLRSIALATKFPPGFFRQQSSSDFPMGSLLYRSHTQVSARERTQTFRMTQLMFDLLCSIVDKIELPAIRIPKLSEDPVTAAQLTRAGLGLAPDTPVRHLIHVLEKAGVWVFALPISIDGLDAFSAWAGIDRQRPVIAVLANRTGDRMRFSVAHELGHLVLHYQMRGQIPDFEREANAFSGEFLLPEAAVKQEIIPPVTLSSLSALRSRWKVSIQALATRAHDVNLISERQYRYLFQQLSAKGWRKNEPGSSNIEVERPRAFRTAIEVAFGPDADLNRISAATNIPVKLLRALLTGHEHISQNVAEPNLISFTKGKNA